MKLLVFGASGLTGREIVKQALDQNHAVTAFVRSPEKFDIRHENLKVAQGDVVNRDNVERAVEGQDAALIALGSASPLARNPALVEGTRNIVRAMEAASVRRLVYESALGAGDSFVDASALARYFVFPVILRNPLADHEEDEKLIKASNLDWVIVRPTRLVNGPRTGKYKTGVHVADSLFGNIARADVADFMLEQTHDDRFLRLTPNIRY